MTYDHGSCMQWHLVCHSSHTGHTPECNSLLPFFSYVCPVYYCFFFSHLHCQRTFCHSRAKVYACTARLALFPRCTKCSERGSKPLAASLPCRGPKALHNVSHGRPYAVRFSAVFTQGQRENLKHHAKNVTAKMPRLTACAPVCARLSVPLHEVFTTLMCALLRITRGNVLMRMSFCSLLGRRCLSERRHRAIRFRYCCITMRVTSMPILERLPIAPSGSAVLTSCYRNGA